MSTSYAAIASVTPSSSSDAYIYSIVPTRDNSLGVLTSANELLILARSSLGSTPALRTTGLPEQASCLVRGDEDGNIVLCSGSDGQVATFDIRSQTKVACFKTDRAISALACKGHAVAVGTELSHHQAVVSLWDRRQSKQIWQNAENNDDITALDFHPTMSHLVLVGGDDGQVSIFDTTIAEEEDSLVQGVNQGPVHKAGFLSTGSFFGLSSDQNLSIYPLTTPEAENDATPTIMGDLRPIMKCEYIIDVLKTGGGFAVVAGSNQTDARIDIVDLEGAFGASKTPHLDMASMHTLVGAHGEEIVRSIFVDDQSGLIFTAGEDGAVKSFQKLDHRGKDLSSVQAATFKKGSGTRYKPY